MSNQLKSISKYAQNRELSWLRFNARVLEQGGEESVPLMEQLKFVSIFTSNLDEFFMVRVGSLADMALVEPHATDNKSGWTAKEQLEKIYEAVRPLYEQKTAIYYRIKEGLKLYGVHPLNFCDLAPSEVKYVKNYYRSNIKPILSPQIVDAHHPFPHIPNKEICILLALKRKNENILGILPLPSSLPEVLYLPGSEIRFIRLEHILLEFASEMFSRYEITEKNIACITRNADITTRFDVMEYMEDFRTRMRKLLSKRKRLAVVRLELNYPVSEQFKSMLCQHFKIMPYQIFISATALKMGYIFDLFAKLTPPQKKQLVYAPFTPTPSVNLNPNFSILKQVQKKDVLLHYPYESMDIFLQMIREAAHNPDVISIKITIYRLAKKAKLVDYICAAAENGKDVTVLLELRARFDEQNNIDWSEKLEDAGCKIIYGFDEYKVHSKICLITMKEKNDVSYITQVGTGNYNENTAKLYTDFSLITADHNIGQDAVEFFKNMSIGNSDGNYGHLLVAPTTFKPTLLSLIDEQIALGEKGMINIKINSLTDVDFIEKLRDASRAGVTVRLVVRGICCLVPGVPDETENVRIISIVGRFLEHTRIYSFGSGEDRIFYISSADLMTRNTERRIEVACPIYDKDIKAELEHIQETAWQDTVKARELLSDGSYKRTSLQHGAVDSQEALLLEYAERFSNHGYPTLPEQPTFMKRIGNFFKQLFSSASKNKE